MTKDQVNVINRYYGTTNESDAETLVRILTKTEVEQSVTMFDYCEANPDRCEYYVSKKGKQLVRVTFETGVTKVFEVSNLRKTSVVKY